jgi:hypothetical protein
MGSLDIVLVFKNLLEFNELLALFSEVGAFDSCLLFFFFFFFFLHLKCLNNFIICS